MMGVSAALLVGAVSAQDFAANLKGKPMVAFKMTDTNGKTITNQSLKGKVVLLDFWATWCGPCKAASPTMQSLNSKYGSKGLTVIGANTFEQPANRKTAAAGYAKEHKYTYTFTVANDDLAKKLGITGIPAFVLIDRKGNVLATMMGFDEGSTPAQMEAAVKKALAGK